MKTTFSSVDQMGEMLRHHRERHTVLAGNVANVDTPGYTPVDLVARPIDGAVGAASAQALARTDGAHVDGPGGSAAGTLIEDPGSVGADGNAVDLERELAKIDANRVRYNACAELASRRLGLLRYAAGDGNG